MIASEIVVLGANHRTAPLRIRERLAVAGSAAPALVRQVVGEGLIAEGVFLSTCNRVEIYAVLPAGPDPQGRALEAFVAILGIDPVDLADAIYLQTGRAAVAHLLRVSCGLDSLVLGETQILGQVRDAFAAAVAAGGTGPVLNRLFHRTAWLADGRFKRIEVDHQHLNRRDALSSHFGDMGRVRAPTEQPAVDFRVERLDPPIQNLRRARIRRHIGDGQAGVPQGFRRPACGEQLIAFPG